VANLRGLRQRISDEIERCQVTGKKLALLAIDLDEFKAVNDRYSHTRGDEVLVATASAIRDQVRADELVARRGGDEFAAVCVFDDESAARDVALRIADAIAETRIQLCPDTRPTASVGYIVWMPGESTEAFLSRADRELHGAKERSRAVRVA
jgi:diguanylate cyclase (GGDEF)-like protein